MSSRLPCPHCEHPLNVDTSPGRPRSHVVPFALTGPPTVIRRKRCPACGWAGGTAEVLVSDIPYAVLAYHRVDQQN